MNTSIIVLLFLTVHMPVFAFAARYHTDRQARLMEWKTILQMTANRHRDLLAIVMSMCEERLGFFMHEPRPLAVRYADALLWPLIAIHKKFNRSQQ